jgi:hypothetical protein
MDKLIVTDLAIHGVSVVVGYLTYKFVRQGLWWAIAKTQGGQDIPGDPYVHSSLDPDPREESDSPVSSSEIVQS